MNRISLSGTIAESIPTTTGRSHNVTILQVYNPDIQDIITCRIDTRNIEPAIIADLQPGAKVTISGHLRSTAPQSEPETAEVGSIYVEATSIKVTSTPAKHNN